MPEGKSEIPADILAAAYTAVCDAIGGKKTLEQFAMPLAKAILAEREACAKIANDLATDLRNGGQVRFTAAKIANSIRARTPPSSTEER